MSRARISLAALAVALAAGVAIAVYFSLRSTPKPEPPFPVRFVDVTERAGIRFHHFNGMTGRKLLPETMGSGVAVIDFDRDGWPDLFFVNSRPWPGQPTPITGKPTQALFRNGGDGTFTDVTLAVGLDVELFGMGVAVADYDNDGWPDLFVTAVGGNKLFQNLNGKRFEDVTAAAGVAGPSRWPAVDFEQFLKSSEPIPFPSSAAWLDFDRDGRLDLFVCNYLTWSPAADVGVRAVLPNGVRAYVPPTQFPPARCHLYRNVDGKRFTELTDALRVEAKGRGGSVGKALGVCVCDPDRDGWPDIIVACDTTPNLFFHNVPATSGGRKFDEIGLSANVAYVEGQTRGGMGIDAAELLPDSLAIAVVNFSDEPNTLLQLVRTGPLVFSDAAMSTGLAGPSRAPMKFGAVFLDFDLDGRQDFFTANGHLEPDIASAQAGQTYPQAAQLFWNTGGSPLWSPTTPEQVGPDLFQPLVGRGCAYLDYDGDGDLDLVVTENGGRARLFRNDNGTGSNWVVFSLVGSGSDTNRDAVGAEITVEAGGLRQRRYLTTARGYLSQSTLAMTFGLAAAETVDKVTVRWPNRAARAETWMNLPARTRHTLSERGK